jgi:excisionase family DNA binding protein
MTQPDQPSRLLTVAAARERLGMSKDKLYELMRAGELAFVKLPPYTQHSGRRIEEAEIEAFIARNRQSAPAAP